MTLKALILLCFLSATPVLGDVTVRFTEGAPKDRFTIENTATVL